MKYYLLAFKNYFVFKGRSNRSEYWYYFLINFLFAITAMVLDTLLNLSFDNSPYGLLYLIYVVISFIPGLSVLVRRLHDVDKSGWFFFISLIPLVGSIWLLVVLATKGTEGDNQYGPDPNGEGPLFDFERAETSGT